MEFEDQVKVMDSIAEWSEKYGFYGALFYYSHSSLDPWISASRIIQKTDRLVPLIATQPYVMSPLQVAKMVSTISVLFGRQVCLNLIAGVSETEQASANQSLSASERYVRIEEYITVLKELLSSAGKSCNYSGQYYKFNGVSLKPGLNPLHMPEFFVPGSSKDSIRVAHAQAGSALVRPEPIDSFKEKYVSHIDRTRLNLGIRIAVLARPTSEEAWKDAEKLFPETRSGRLSMVLKKSLTSENSKQMVDLALNQTLYDNVYWMGAYSSGMSTDPYLVGSYQEVADYLQEYIDCGVTTILLGDLYTEDGFFHFSQVKELLTNQIRENA